MARVFDNLRLNCTSVECDYTIISPPFDLHGYLKMHFRHQISSRITFSKYLKFENIYKGAVCYLSLAVL